MGDQSNAEAAGPPEGSGLSRLVPDAVGDACAVDYIFSIRTAERRLIADELHDTACQLLALVQLNLGRIRRQAPDEQAATITECEEMISRIGRHLRDVCRVTPQ